MIPTLILGSPIMIDEYIWSLTNTTVSLTGRAPGTIIPVHRCKGSAPGPERYIVTFNKVKVDDVQKLFGLGKLVPLRIISTSTFSIPMDNGLLTKMQSHESVVSIRQVCPMKFVTTVKQDQAPWGIARLSRGAKKLSNKSLGLVHRFKYDSSAGACADIYFPDTGVQIAHNEFEGRARWPAEATFGDHREFAHVDDIGHGTQCAAIAAGVTYGVAKKAHVIAVKMGSRYESYSDNMIKALEWILANHDKSRVSIVSISSTVEDEPELDKAVENLIKANIHVVVGAGNDNMDAKGLSPARVKSVITVGATANNDGRAVDSNFGSVVDVYAPGKDITTAFIGANDASTVQSGTSLATAHVSGLLAHELCRTGNVPPETMHTRLIDNSLKNVVYFLRDGDNNRLAQMAPLS
ncbi:hypothetical protein CVT24_002612 [Panaeolus cyanescens]|uniref:Peptidase S8/S53 domain-containing protein n=1 Tax=Panaeolus cyanescens TaxID=181874 RepID=A0A409YTZ8_9AGAR|nr:hypothetical protein CVT24_002612 [Panaeolus cyanescens]